MTLDAVAAWAASGAMALTGRSDGPALGPPEPLVGQLEAWGRMLCSDSGAVGRRVAVDPLHLLVERAAIAGLHRRGATSCGGATRLLRAGDGWIAVALARAEDVEAVPAWLQRDGLAAAEDVWDVVERSVARRPTDALIADAGRLGLPVAALPAAPPVVAARDGPFAPLPVRAVRLGSAPARDLSASTVIDVSALWAGPLCGRLLAEAGARVAKVESASRPDGARRGPAAFFDLLNAGKESVALDLTSAGGAAQLAAVVGLADVVIEASRPRALRQLGLDAAQLVASGSPQVWVSITAYGRAGAAGDRVGFGDDSAVAGGLVAWDGSDGSGPCFCADAVADPATGLVAAAAAVHALASGGRWLVDIALRDVAASLAGRTLPAGDRPATPPRAPCSRGVARPLGADTEVLLTEARRRR